MITPKVSIDFSKNKFSDLELFGHCFYVLKKMDNNPNFTDPEPALSVLLAAYNKYSKALNHQKYRSNELTLIKKMCRRNLEQLLKQLAIYVGQKANQDAAIILSSGFDLQKSKVKVGELEMASGLTVRFGCNHGSLIVSCQVINKARWYDFEYTLFPATDESIWIRQSSTRRKIEINGLTSGQKYVFRVAGAATNNCRAWSNQVVSYAV